MSSSRVGIFDSKAFYIFGNSHYSCSSASATKINSEIVDLGITDSWPTKPDVEANLTGSDLVSIPTTPLLPVYPQN